MVGACHIAVGEVCLGAYPGVGAFHSHKQNSYLGAYPGYYGTYHRRHKTKDKRACNCNIMQSYSLLQLLQCIIARDDVEASMGRASAE